MPTAERLTWVALLFSCEPSEPRAAASAAPTVSVSSSASQTVHTAQLPPSAQVTAVLPELHEPPAGMVFVPGGAFEMGCVAARDDDCNLHEQPRHQVELAPYFIDRTEVTVAAYRQCTNAGVCSAVGLDQQADLGGHPAQCNAGRADRDDHPINCVGWPEAERYCSWAHKRLPTEAEWEKAARGTDGRMYPWGHEDVAEREDLAVVLRLQSGPPDRLSPPFVNSTWPVGSKPRGASPYGALDMAGNVWEWTADWFDKDYYRRAPKRDPRGPAQGSARVIRGNIEPRSMRATLRASLAPATRLGVLGFRCAQDASPASSAK